eukprot:7684030-Ditylum_brightwellii.AAC.1
MAKPFNLVAPIEDLFSQNSNGQDLAVAAGVPYLEMQLVTKAYDLIFKTGVHQNMCKEWKCRTVADRTYANLQLHFTMTHHELHQLQTVARQQAEYMANNAEY